MKKMYYSKSLHRAMGILCMGLIFSSALIIGCSKKNDGPPTGPALSITSFSPEAGAEGATVEIIGTAFDEDEIKHEVKFNGLKAVVKEATQQKLTVTVPENAKTGKITFPL